MLISSTCVDFRILQIVTLWTLEEPIASGLWTMSLIADVIVVIVLLCEYMSQLSFFTLATLAVLVAK